MEETRPSERERVCWGREVTQGLMGPGEDFDFDSERGGSLERSLRRGRTSSA